MFPQKYGSKSSSQCHIIQNSIEVLNINNKLSALSLSLEGTTKALKCIKSLIFNHLTECVIVNKCLELETFSGTLKIAKVTLVFKAGNKSDGNNYSPFSVLPLISKIFEKVIHSRLLKHLNEINFIYYNYTIWNMDFGYDLIHYLQHWI